MVLKNASNQSIKNWSVPGLHRAEVTWYCTSYWCNIFIEFTV